LAYTYTDNSFRINYNGAGADEVVIDSGGQVGIGTSSPQEHLHVSGTGTQRLEVETTQAANSAILKLTSTAGSYGVISDASDALTFYDYGSTAERMRIASDGSVGIGTSSPSFEGGTGTGLEINNSSGNGAHVKLTDAASGSGGTNGFDLYAFNTSGYIENYEAGSIVFRNGGSERARLDASGKLLVGKTSAGYSTDGFETHPNGETYVSRSGTPMAINRNSSDGTLLNFYKDGSGVGSIEANAGYLKINSGNTSFGSGIEFHNLKAMPVGANGASSNGTVNLGETDRRWKDLYLSGGVFLGGTGSSNKLDDYEEGNWTPSSPTVTFTGTNGRYTKIGRQVFYQGSVTVPSTSSSVQFNIDGFPFSQPSNGLGAAYLRYTDNGTAITFHQNTGTRLAAYNLNGTSTTLASVSGKRFDFVGSYFVA
jgi:hypothetical protein